MENPQSLTSPLITLIEIKGIWQNITQLHTTLLRNWIWLLKSVPKPLQTCSSSHQLTVSEPCQAKKGQAKGGRSPEPEPSAERSWHLNLCWPLLSLAKAQTWHLYLFLNERRHKIKEFKGYVHGISVLAAVAWVSEERSLNIRSRKVSEKRALCFLLIICF